VGHAVLPWGRSDGPEQAVPRVAGHEAGINADASTRCFHAHLYPWVSTPSGVVKSSTAGDCAGGCQGSSKTRPMRWKTRPMRWGSRRPIQCAGAREGLGFARASLVVACAGASRARVQCARPRRCCAREPYGTAFLSRLQASPACPQCWACTGISFERCGGAVAVLLPRRSHHRPVRCRCRSPMTMITTNMITTNSSLPSS